MIEIGEKSKTSMTYDEAVLYCFSLGDGWRMPTKEEFYKYVKRMTWFQDDTWSHESTLTIIPVRDIIDDDPR